MSRDWPQFRLRLPAELDRAIEAQAVAHRRTKNGEMVVLLERAIAQGASDGAQVGAKSPVAGEPGAVTSRALAETSV